MASRFIVRESIRLWAGLLLVSALALANSPELEHARKLYQLTDFEGVIAALQRIPQKDADTLELLGRACYGLGDYKKATDYLDKAFALTPNSSHRALWLGRAYGRRAETSSPFTAPGNASKARQWFEKAVALDPNSIEAMNDLFEYYLEAPGFLGGGYDKAARLSARIASLDSAEGHWTQAKLAEKRKEFGTAEAQLRRAAEAAPQQVGRVIDLAKFLARQGKYQESEQNFQRASQIAPKSPQLVYARAETYINTGRNVDTARKLLEQYLSLTLSPDDPPRSEAEKLLKQVSGS